MSAPYQLPVYGERRITLFNLQGVRTLYLREVRRFMKVYQQTLAAPAVMALLYLAIFALAMGRGSRTVLGVPFPDFIAPGLIAMAMIQNAFANTSSSLVIGKVQGTIIDLMMPPLSAGELVTAFVGGALTRAVLVGVTVWLVVWAWPGVGVSIQHPWAVAYFGLMGAMMLALLGILTGLWAEKFDNAAFLTNFVIQPMSLLSGTFYALAALPAFWREVSLYNPFFHIIDGFRYGFIGTADAPLLPGAIALALINIGLWMLCYHLLRIGWRIRA